jgi:putative acetyltransferase
MMPGPVLHHRTGDKFSGLVIHGLPGCIPFKIKSMYISIRQEQAQDQKQVFHVHSMAFGQEDEARLVDALRPDPAFIPELSLVAIIDESIVGHILFSRITIKAADGTAFDSLALAPMAVMPDFQHKGIGSMLVKSGLARALELGYASVIVLGHEHFYPRFGFAPASKWNIKAPFEVPDKAFMALELVPGSLHHISGTVIYPEPFAAV